MIRKVQSGDGAKLIDRSLDKSPAEIQNFLDNHLVSREDILNERLDLTRKQKDFESRMKDADANTKKALQVELTAIADRIGRIDKNVKDYRLPMKTDDSDPVYLSKLQESFQQEQNGLRKIKDELKSHLSDLKKQVLKDQKAIDTLDKQIDLIEQRLTTAGLCIKIV